MASVEVPTLWRPPGKPPTFGTAAPTHDCVSPGPTQNSVSSQRSSHQRHQTHDKGRGKSSLVACKWQVGRKPGPKPAPRVGPTPAPTASTPKRKTTATKDVPRPRPPPQARCGSLPKYCIQRGSSPGSDGSNQSEHEFCSPGIWGVRHQGAWQARTTGQDTQALDPLRGRESNPAVVATDSGRGSRAGVILTQDTMHSGCNLQCSYRVVAEAGGSCHRTLSA